MEDVSNKPEEGVGLDEGNPQGGQAQKSADVIELEKYKALESEYTRNRQSLIAAEVSIAKEKPERIKAIADVKLQNAVIKEVYGLNNLQELKAVYGEKFHEASGDDVDEVEKIKRELNFLKYESTKGKLELAISSFKSENKALFEEEGAEGKFKDAIEVVSKDLPEAERVRIASQIAFWKVGNPTKEAFKDMMKATSTASPPPSADKGEKKESNQEKLREFFLGTK